MKFLKYLLLASNLVLVLETYGENINEIKNKPSKWQTFEKDYERSLNDYIKWEIVPEDKKSQKDFIKWEIYQEEKDSIKILEDSKSNIYNAEEQKLKSFDEQIRIQEILNITPHIPLNNYLDYRELVFSSNWKSAFSGGAGGGTGHQNIAIKFDYGLTNDSLLSIYLSETDDPLYNLVGNKLIPNNWASLALAYKKKIFESENLRNNLSLASSFEYFVISSGSSNTKSIYNEIDNSVGHDRHEKFIYSLSLPFTRKLNNKTKFSIVPGSSFMPDKLGEKNVGKNFYGNNFFLSSGLNFNLTKDIQLIGSYTNLFGPGHNSFNKNLVFERKPIYSYGFNWNVNPIIGIEGKITNGYGSTPSTSLLTIPSDNKPLYYLGGSYRPFSTDTKYTPLKGNDEMLLLGGLTVNNALIPARGTSQISLDYDARGNASAFYGYSLSNIFQLETRIGSFNDVKLASAKNSKLQNIFLGKNNFNYRFGGKLSIFSPQKGDLFWTSLRASLGRNESPNHQGYSFLELINTFKVNDLVYFNFTPKYFYSGFGSFGGIGMSTHVKLFDNLHLIPEVNSSVRNEPDLNSSISLRYTYKPQKSIDFYYSNAAGIQDIGQLLEAKDHRFGIKLNLLY